MGLLGESIGSAVAIQMAKSRIIPHTGHNDLFEPIKAIRFINTCLRLNKINN
jgi:hypothetical protein